MDDIDGRQTHVRVEVSAATDDDDHNNEDTAAITSNDSANNVITSIIVDNRDDKERHCVSLPLYYDQGELCALGSGPGMECMPLRSPPGAYHYHVNDQTKSLQELQNEVGALLEFRDLVIETFPDLKNKMASISASNTITGAPSSSLASRREWEPGIRVRRKLTQKETVVDISSSSLIRSRSNSHSGKKEPKSGEGNNGSVVQDSGFSTETSSSKETHSASSTTGSSTVVPIATGSNVTNSASNTLATHRIISTSATHDTEDELWNLLDVIHRKSTRLREEVENLQQLERDSRMHQANSNLSEMFQLELNRINKEDIQLLRKDRDRLLDKLAEMEAETIAARIKSTRVEDEMKALNLVKCDLEEQLRTALSQKFELNTRLNELVGNSDRNIGDINPNSLTDSKNSSRLRSRKLSSPDTVVTISPYTNRMLTGTNTFSPIVVKSSQQQQQQHQQQQSQLQHTQFEPVDAKQIKNDFNLGRLDGLVSSPNRSSKVRVADSNKIAAILLETNIVELQRHLLTITVQNQVLTQRLEQATKSKIYLIKKLDKAKEEMDDLRFQLEERNIELEGTKAQLRVLESRTIGVKSDFSPQHMLHNHCDLPLIQTQVSTPSMKAMIPLPMDDIQNHSSSTESAHDHAERDNRTCPDTPKRRPSKIPLPGTKGYLAPKPPTGRNFVNSKSPSGPPSNKSLSKSTSSLIGRSGPSSIQKTLSTTKPETPSSLNRPESAQSLRKDTSLGNTSRNGSSIPISSSKVSPSRTNNSPVPKAKRESFTSKVRHMDSLSRMHTSPSHSNATTTPITPSNSTTSLYKSNMGKDLSSSFSSGRERRQSYNSNHSTTSSPTAGSTPIRRGGSNANGGNKGIDLTTTTEPVEKVPMNLRRFWNMLKI